MISLSFQRRTNSNIFVKLVVIFAIFALVASNYHQLLEVRFDSFVDDAPTRLAIHVLEKPQHHSCQEEFQFSAVELLRNISNSTTFCHPTVRDNQQC